MIYQKISLKRYLNFFCSVDSTFHVIGKMDYNGAEPTCYRSSLRQFWLTKWSFFIYSTSRNAPYIQPRLDWILELCRTFPILSQIIDIIARQREPDAVYFGQNVRIFVSFRTVLWPCSCFYQEHGGTYQYIDGNGLMTQWLRNSSCRLLIIFAKCISRQ